MRLYRCHGYPIKLAGGDRCSLLLSRSLASPLRRKKVREEDVSGGLTSRPGEEGEQSFHEPWSSQVPVGFELSVCERGTLREVKKERDKSQGREEREKKKRTEFSYSYIYSVHNEVRHLSVLSFYTFILPLCQISVAHTH